MDISNFPLSIPCRFHTKDLMKLLVLHRCWHNIFFYFFYFPTQLKEEANIRTVGKRNSKDSLYLFIPSIWKDRFTDYVLYEAKLLCFSI